MNPVAKRTFTGIATGALVIGMFLYCPMRAFLPIIIVLSSLLQLEFYSLVKKSKPVQWLGLAFGCVYLLWVGLFCFDIKFNFSFLALSLYFQFGLPVAAALVSLVVLFTPGREDPVASISSTIFGFIYVPFLMSFFLLLTQMTGSGFWGDGGSEGALWTRTGLYTLLALVATAKFSDTGGFAFGLAFGKHKMCPSISPKKSWEGLLGSVVFAAITMCVFYRLSVCFSWGRDIAVWNRMSYPVAAVTGAVLALVATLGDLVESRFKRAAGVKDSSSFMPAGIGGFLDMFDSILFLPALAFAAVVFDSI